MVIAFLRVIFFATLQLTDIIDTDM